MVQDEDKEEEDGDGKGTAKMVWVLALFVDATENDWKLQGTSIITSSQPFS
jgi:hypothetical protein